MTWKTQRAYVCIGLMLLIIGGIGLWHFIVDVPGNQPEWTAPFGLMVGLGIGALTITLTNRENR